MNDGTSIGGFYEVAQRVVRIGLEHPDWRAEIYLQLCKQTTYHPFL